MAQSGPNGKRQIYLPENFKTNFFLGHPVVHSAMGGAILPIQTAAFRRHVEKKTFLDVTLILEKKSYISDFRDF